MGLEDTLAFESRHRHGFAVKQKDILMDALLYEYGAGGVGTIYHYGDFVFGALSDMISFIYALAKNAILCHFCRRIALTLNP